MVNEQVSLRGSVHNADNSLGQLWISSASGPIHNVKPSHVLDFQAVRTI